MNSLEIEIAVSELFGVRRHLMVPNVSWGLGIHECDMLIVTKSGYANEVEIKISQYDLKQDQKKTHGHRSRLIRRLFFAIPMELQEFGNYVPERAGIIVVNNGCSHPSPGNNNQPWCKITRPAQINKDAKPLSQEQIIHLGRLASMRIWSLKRTILLRKEEETRHVD